MSGCPPAIELSPQTVAEAAGLRYVCDSAPGITRERRGKAFCYRLPDGSLLRESNVLDRIRALAIPPAYNDVWICPSARGHIQATARDARGRKQYRYHPDWQMARGAGKFERLPAFGRALPRLRRHLRRDLQLRGFPRDKVLAVVVSVLAQTLVRVGNVRYARLNRSFGLTTLRNRHIDFLRGGRARLKFRGKGGREHDIEVDDGRLVRLVRSCQELPGQALFQYRDGDGTLQPVDSDNVNAYLRASMGDAFTAKDFRTWAGTLLAFQRLAKTPLPLPSQTGAPSKRALAAVRTEVIREVADALGNTPAVCRKAYIDPRVFDGWESGRLAAAAHAARGARQWEHALRSFLETASTTRL